MPTTWLHVLIAAGLLINGLSLFVTLVRLKRLQLPRSERTATATIILPLTGRAENLDRIFGALESQTLPPRRIIVAVESKDDPAYGRARSAARETRLKVETAVAGPATNQAQKCRNQQAALELIDYRDDVIVFMDGDVVPQLWWLSALVSPIVDDHSDVVTGHRWQMPAAPWLGAHLVTAIDRGVTLMPRVDAGFAHVIWGGSVALSRAAAAKMNLTASLDRTLSDDLSVSEQAAAAGLRILTRGALLVPSPCDLHLAAAWRFARRQYQIGHIYRPWLWRLASAVILTRLGAWIAGIAEILTGGSMAWAALALAQLAIVRQAAVAEFGARAGLPDTTRTTLMQLLLALAQPVVDVFHASVIVAAASTRRVRWGHIDYEVGGPYDIRVKERRPFPAS